MTRKEAHAKVEEWMDETHPDEGGWHYGRPHLHRDIDRIYDDIKELLKWLEGLKESDHSIIEIDTMIKALKNYN